MPQPRVGAAGGLRAQRQQRGEKAERPQPLRLPCLDNLMRQPRGKSPSAEHVANQEE